MLLFSERISGALHVRNHAGSEEQRHAEDSGLQPRAGGETEEAAKDAGEGLSPLEGARFVREGPGSSRDVNKGLERVEY